MWRICERLTKNTYFEIVLFGEIFVLGETDLFLLNFIFLLKGGKGIEGEEDEESVVDCGVGGGDSYFNWVCLCLE